MSQPVERSKSRIKKTGDGSDTLISEQFDQSYHSLSGAVSESRYVYFESSGLNHALATRANINILEIGFGSGMNLILLMDYLHQTNAVTSVEFTSVEAHPINRETALTLNFGDSLSHLNYSEYLSPIFDSLSPGMNRFEISSNVTLSLFVGLFQEFIEFLESNNGSTIADGRRFDFVLHDPFSPESNPDGWTPELFKAIANECKTKAMLTTYSAATSARAAMAVAGWKIARAPGALGKREMTIASLDADNLVRLKRVNEKRLVERLKAGDFD